MYRDPVRHPGADHGTEIILNAENITVKVRDLNKNELDGFDGYIAPN